MKREWENTPLADPAAEDFIQRKADEVLEQLREKASQDQRNALCAKLRQVWGDGYNDGMIYH